LILIKSASEDVTGSDAQSGRLPHWTKSFKNPMNFNFIVKQG
jgi:hypothetical protein